MSQLIDRREKPPGRPRRRIGRPPRAATAPNATAIATPDTTAAPSVAAAAPPAALAAAAVAWMGAIQAQDFEAALWAVGLRSGATEAAVRQAVADGTIVRTWPNRGTLHFVAADDARWLVELMAPRSIARNLRRQEELGLDAATIRQAEKAAIKTLSGGRHLGREAFFAQLEDAGISTAGQRGYHLAWRLGQHGLLCFGPPAGKQQTFALLDEWVPGARSLRSMPRAQALAELAARYFVSHGPAGIPDFAWWAGLTVTEATQATRDGEAAASGSAAIASETIGGRTWWSAATGPSTAAAKAGSRAHLLPSFDEYLLGYTDRAEVLAPRHADRVAPGANGLFLPIVVTARGAVAGTWKRSFSADSVTVEPTPFQGSFSVAESRGIRIAADRYAAFLARPLVLAVE